LATVLFLVCLFLFCGILLLGTKTVGSFLKQLILKISDLVTKQLPMIGAFASTRGGMSVMQLIDRVAEGFSIMRNVTDTLICLGLSILYWLLWAAGYYFLSQGSPSINLTFVQAVASMVVICLFIALPSIPGYWGLWEAGGVFSLSLFGFMPEQSAGITLANHVVQMLPICLAGVISAWMTGFHLSRVHSSAISSCSDDVQ
jgi:glycosyltransferase 2 family protein